MKFEIPTRGFCVITIHLDEQMVEANIPALIYDFDGAGQIWKCLWVEIPLLMAYFKIRTHVNFAVRGKALADIQASPQCARNPF